jgi:predicted transcriptional regulator of viral defense system
MKNPPPTEWAPMQPLDIINKLAQRSETFTFADFATIHGGPSPAAANALRGLVRKGIVDRVSRGAYVIRPIGRLGTAAGTEDIALVVGARFADGPHRIAYSTALDIHGLLTRPLNNIQLATVGLVEMAGLGGRPFHSIVEAAVTIHIGAIDAGHNARVSDIERSMIDAARRIGLVGGVSVLGDALSRLAPNDYNPDLVVDYASKLQAPGPLRRLGSIARATGHNALADATAAARRHRHRIGVDPRVSTEPGWVDPEFKVVWAQEQLDELGLERTTGQALVDPERSPTEGSIGYP